MVDLIALGVLASLILGVYLAKTIAGRERAEIATIDRKIEAERARIRLLQAEVSHLEQPARIEGCWGSPPFPPSMGQGSSNSQIWPGSRCRRRRRRWR